MGEIFDEGSGNGSGCAEQPVKTGMKKEVVINKIMIIDNLRYCVATLKENNILFKIFFVPPTLFEELNVRHK